ncbi:HesA/MoeB/ThiF family protein [Niabella insulamsoli]|uniref:HesA/MoeB/ThiF family protein n=1 Tax=Niabella insulamsoli TaxID=3144874 RepID=UPI0031FBA543
MSHHDLYARYQRQLGLKGFGVEAQQKLARARVLVAGAGGLGCPLLQYLAAAGVGCIGVIDDDRVSVSNLHRQVLFSTADIGEQKAVIAGRKIKQINPEIDVQVYADRLNVENVIGLVSEYDIVVDGTDNFSTRYLINDVCVWLGKPLVYGAVSQFEGQLTVLNWKANPGELRPVQYRDLFLEPPSGIRNCEEEGVLGVLPGLIGVLMATEVIKLITGIGEVLNGRLLLYNLLTHQTYEMALSVNEAANAFIPKSTADLKAYFTEDACSGALNEIDAATFDKWMKSSGVLAIDVREPGEAPIVTSFPHMNIPAGCIEQQLPLTDKKSIVLFCKSGQRSAEAAKKLTKAFAHIDFFSLRGGLDQYLSKIQ